MKSYTYLKTNMLGELLLVANPTQLVGVYFANCDHAQKPLADSELNPKHPVLRQAAEEIQDYLKGKRTSFLSRFPMTERIFKMKSGGRLRSFLLVKRSVIPSWPGELGRPKPFALRERPRGEIHWALLFPAIVSLVKMEAWAVTPAGSIGKGVC